MPLTGEDRFRSWAVDAIDRYEDACTQGLDDFEKSFPDKGSSTDWTLFATTVLGNLIWALACFETGGAAFFISLAGIGVGTAAAAEMAAGQEDGFDKSRFHAATREQVSGQGGLKEQLLALVPHRAQAMAAESAHAGWDATTGQTQLLKRMFGPEFITQEAGIPKVDKWAVAKQVEADLLLEAASSMPYSNAKGIDEGSQHGVYLEIQCAAAGAMEDDGHRTTPVNHWDVHLKRATLWDHTGQFPQMADRLNEIFGRDLNRPITLMDWPLRKHLWITPTGHNVDDNGPSIEIILDEKSAITAWKGWDLVQPRGRTYLEVVNARREPGDDEWNPEWRPVSEQTIRELLMSTRIRAKRVHEVEKEPHDERYAHLDDRAYQWP